MNDTLPQSRIRLWLLRILGAIFFVIGAILAVGGFKLASLGGSIYYIGIGLFLMAAGLLAILGRVTGLYVYVLAFLITFVWSLWEVGLDGWALVPRLVGPFILLILAVLVMPPRLRDGTRTRRGLVAGLTAICLLVLVIGVPLAKPSLIASAIPGPQSGNARSNYRQQITPPQ